MNRKITTIQANKQLSHQSKLPSIKKKKVAGYARVSTDNEDQTSSYETQMKYYEEYISSRKDWEFVKMYSDEGISGTNTKKRLGFQEMVNDALAGKIDLILTKSVSRFARNTVDSLSTVRKLKDVGVEIYFEKENIWTFDSKGELLITIMSSLAQEESRSISENITWSKRKQAAEGRVTFAYNNVLGFKPKEDGGFEVDKEQAQIVRYIFGQFLSGKNPNQIAKHLTENKIPTPRGKTRWSYSSVRSILTNEKYKGDALLQKYYVADFLNKTQKRNNGELPQYYVENSHEAIIDKEVFDAVQVQLSENKKWYTEKNYFGKIRCGCCGSSFVRHLWHSTDKYKETIYRCKDKYKNEEKCDTPHIRDDEIQRWIVSALNKVIDNRKEIIGNIKLLMKMIKEDRALDDAIIQLEGKLENIRTDVEKLIIMNSKIAQDQEEYTRKYNKLIEEYKLLEKQLEQKNLDLLSKNKRVRELKIFIDSLEKQDELLTEYDTKLFNYSVEKIIIHKGKRIEIYLKNGEIITI